MVKLTPEDEGKRVVDRSGGQIGVVTHVKEGTAYVEPTPGLTDTLKSSLGWGQDIDTHTLPEGLVERVTETEVVLGKEVSDTGQEQGW